MSFTYLILGCIIDKTFHICLYQIHDKEYVSEPIQVNLALNTILDDIGTTWNDDVMKMGGENIAFHFTIFPKYSDFSKKFSGTVTIFERLGYKFDSILLVGFDTLRFHHTPKTSISNDFYKLVPVLFTHLHPFFT